MTPIKPKKSKTEKVTVDPMTGRKTYTVKGKTVGTSATSTYAKGTSSVKPGPEAAKKATTPAAKKAVTKPVKKEYDSYTDMFKGENTYKKGTKAVAIKKKK